MPKPPIGLQHRQSLEVDPALTLAGMPTVLGDFLHAPRVLATPYMIALIETACGNCVASYLDKHQRTIGSHVDIRHLAPVGVGAIVIAETELVSNEGKVLRFRVMCRNGSKVIGMGFHERVIVEASFFDLADEGRS